MNIFEIVRSNDGTVDAFAVSLYINLDIKIQLFYAISDVNIMNKYLSNIQLNVT